MSKVYIQKKISLDGVEEFTVFEVQVRDLDLPLLKAHFRRAIDEEDYDYADAVKAEAGRRGIEIIYNKS